MRDIALILIVKCVSFTKTPLFIIVGGVVRGIEKQ